jgi:hypothetical protein
MTRRCGSCGAPAPDDTSVFCNRCGARLPVVADRPACCRQCGCPVTDPLARFCNRCGAPLLPPVLERDAPGRRPKKICESCGFENFGQNLFYCNKCGAIFPKYEGVQQSIPAEKRPARGAEKGPIRIVADGMDEFRQQPVAAPAIPAEAPVQLRRPAAPAGAAAHRTRRPVLPETWKTGSGRKIAIAIAVLVIIIIALVVTGVPDMIRGGSPDAAPDPGSSVPGLLEALPWIHGPGLMPVINQGTAVVTDTLLTPT